jgi:ATP-dependent exoDNAse (exonuclease V) alpha subunit
MHLKNDIKRDVMNGDLGVIKSVDWRKATIKVAYPPRSSSKGKPHSVEYQRQELGKELQHAWAITVHKVGQRGFHFAVILLLYVHRAFWCAVAE